MAPSRLREAQAEARRKDASAAEAKAQAGAEMRKARGELGAGKNGWGGGMEKYATKNTAVF